MYFVVGAILLHAIGPHLHSMGRKSKKHKGTSDGSDNEADDDRHGTSNLISGMGGANFHMNLLLAL